MRLSKSSFLLVLLLGACSQSSTPGPDHGAPLTDGTIGDHAINDTDAGLHDATPPSDQALPPVKDSSTADQTTLPAGPGVYPYGQCQGADPPAKLVSEGSPAPTLATGSKAGVWVVFANCGTKPWKAGVHKLGSQAPQDNKTWGLSRVALPGDVPPGQMARIDFTITAPAQPGSYGYQWQVLEEGVSWIPEPSPLHTIVVQDLPAKLADLWAGTAAFVPDQDPVPVNGPSSGHREAFAINRTDIGPTTVYLYHRCFGQSTADASICLSISSDGGNTFSQFLGEIVGPDPGHIFSVAPAVIHKGAKWYMVYEESNVAALYWAESSDGKSWSKKGQLLSKTTQTWDAGANATPGAFVDSNGTIYVFYAGFPVGGTQMSIGYASGSSMTTLVKHANNPVLTPPASGWNKGQVSMPRVVRQGSYYYMIFEGADTDFTCEGYNRYGWGMARSTDLKSWSPLPANPLGQANSGCGNDMPSLFIRYDDHVFAYHTSVDVKRIVREHLVFK